MNQMNTSAHPERTRSASHPRLAVLSNPYFVAAVFAGLIALQALSFLILGMGRPGRGVSGVLLIVHNLLALACAWSAFRRARSVAALFWFLYTVSLAALLIPTIFGAYNTLFARPILSSSTWRVLYCLYGAPIFMMLFLPDADRERVKSEVFLDLFQVMIVVGLAFFTFFFLPVQQMMAADALLHNVDLSNLQNLFLLGAVLVRLLFVRIASTRNLLICLGVFVLACTGVTFLGNWIDLHQYAFASTWFDLGWALPYGVGGLVALNWRTPAEAPLSPPAPGLVNFLGTNVVLVTLLCSCVGLLMGPWKAVHSQSVTAIALGASLLAFTARLALTQYHQQQEIAQRKAAEAALQKIASIVEFSEDAIYGKTMEGVITAWNRAAERMYGYTSTEAIGRNSSMLVPPEKQAEVRLTMERVQSGQPIEGLETKQLTKAGSLLDVSLTISPIKDTGGRVMGDSSIARDITERIRAQDAIVESESRYRSLFENMLEGCAYCEMIFDDQGRSIDFVYLAVNSIFGKLTGLDDVLGKKLTEVIPGNNDSHSELFERYGRVVQTGVPERFEIEVKALGKWFSVSAYSARNGCFIATFDNITERKQAEQALLFKTALLEAQAETTIDGILVVDELGHIVMANKQFGLHFGIPDALLSARDDRIVLSYVMAKIETPEPFSERVKYLYTHQDEKSSDEFRLKNGKVFDRYSAPLVDSTNQYRGRIWYFRDITEHKIAEERVRFLAYYDALTGLPNRTLLQDRLAKALAGARRQKEKVALLFLDLDGFKNINDSLGHSVGDLLLQEVAERLRRCAREQDTVARLSGDEFLIVLTTVNDIRDAAVAAERLMDAMTTEFVVQGHSLHVSCSIGISIFPEHGADSETLIRNADAAMYLAKDCGRNNFQYFTADMNAQVVERLTLENGLRLALERKELFLMYQPQMDIATGRITGLEALLRWQHPDLGLVPPDRFIRIAESSGLIVPIGEWVLNTVCRQARKWQDEGLPTVTVAVNVSAVQFRQGDFCELIRKVLHETGLAPQYLDLELTESILLANADLMLSVVQELRAMGLALAIDDFGTGYSSFGYLRQFPVSKLKIDSSFIRDVAVKPDDAAITGAIINMAKSLNLKVIAEGVENEAQMSFLRAHQCDEIQGYYFSKPLPVDQVADKLRDTAVHALTAAVQTADLLAVSKDRV